ncbi:MAG TPA: ATPase, T2SS/T4P/T4SS family [Kiritimatiellia bacterium]|nr:ATPase, T2SS/T4P/T4SS family [Kiritimatiellia bacterium]
MRPLGQILIERGIISSSQLEEALARQQALPGRRIGEILIEAGWVSPADVLKALGVQYQCEVLDIIPPEMLDSELVSSLPVEWARSHEMLPVRHRGQPAVLTADPTRINEQDDLSLLTGCPLIPVLALPGLIREAIENCYFMRRETASEVMAGLPAPEAVQPSAAAGATDLLAVATDAPVTRLVNLILLEAVRRRASDIHIEPLEDSLRVRYRIDGMLYEQSAPPRHFEAALVSRLKVMGHLDIAEKRLPQDGMARVSVGERDIDIRISTIPVAEGERIVLRLLNRESTLLPLGRLGMPDHVLRPFGMLLKLNHGAIWVTGPTGSGKTTTLYAALQELDSEHLNILTIEDPVEYQLAHISQISVKPKIGLTFAQGLRHILRQDPDIILVGETRDLETAEIAVRASLTGHLVFSTLHTNDAIGAIVRLVDMGIPRYLVSAATSGVLGQRLIRTLCPECRKPMELSAEDAAGLGPCAQRLKGQPVYDAGNCSACMSGYSGRTGIYELLMMDDAIRDAIRHEADLMALNRAVAGRGFSPLTEDAVEKIQQGITSPAEVLRVLGRFP